MFGRLNEKGFATLEVILMVTVLGILAAVAVPRFTSITTAANTARVQSDLSTLDTAIAIYQMDNGEFPSSVSSLKDYVQNVDNLKPPTGKVYVNGTEKDIEASDYAITTSTTNNDVRATLDGHTIDEFTKPKNTNE